MVQLHECPFHPSATRYGPFVLIENFNALILFETFVLYSLTHWGRVTHICARRLTSIASDNGLSPGRRQAIIWTNAGILLIRSVGTNFSEISLTIQTFSFTKMHLKMSSGKCQALYLGLNELTLLGPLLKTAWRNNNNKSQHGEIITFIIKCAMELVIHSQISTTFEIWEWVVLSSHIL